jgi:putative ABC transport system permease protein
MVNLGDNFIWIENGNRNVRGVRTGAGGAQKLDVEDSQAIVDSVPEVSRCSPNVDGRAQVIHGSQNWYTRYRGVSPDYLPIKAWPISEGAVFSDQDVQARARVAILGRTVATMLFGQDDSVGQSFRMNGQVFTVVAVLQTRGADTGGLDQDDTVMLPYSTAMRYLNNRATRVDDIMCSATAAALIPPAQQDIAALLRIRHQIPDGAPDDFNLRAPDDALKLQEDSARTLGLMLSAIASVSLIVGGVGVMNIMLVSVTERTHEIGIRMAIGARAGDVRVQFLIEAFLLGLAGGAMGVALGLGGSQVCARMYAWPMITSPAAIVVAVVFASGVGLVFGYYPARHASSLDPIEALRVE